uniref:F-box domain-containing protein n=1 Tax=Trypanosoma congolense (strain IL3000) TaxID=1068625 RepID=G0UXY2_TRYCI|nr:conserved hypothetical protein [Trypanosoma congolense IL3000]
MFTTPEEQRDDGVTPRATAYSSVPIGKTTTCTRNPLVGPEHAGSVEMHEEPGNIPYYELPIFFNLWFRQSNTRRCRAEGQWTRVEDALNRGSARLDRTLPPQLLLTIMNFLPSRSILKMRAVCRSFNDVFLTNSIQDTLALSFPRCTVEPTVGFKSITEVMREREAALRNKERMWSKWLSSYLVSWLKSRGNMRESREVTLEGQRLWIQLERARELCHLATEEWLGFLVDSRRAQYNIRRNWFNPTTLGFSARNGVTPIFLADGTLCVNNPRHVVTFYAKRGTASSPCRGLDSKKLLSTLSRVADSLREQWAPLDELVFNAHVCLMYYDPYADVIHISLKNGLCTMWRVSTTKVEEAASRSGADAEPEGPPPHRTWRKTRHFCRSVQSKIEVVGSYNISSDFLASCVTVTRDSIGLKDYLWSEDEIMAKTRLLGECPDKDASRIIVARHGRDVSSSFLPKSEGSGAHLTREDVSALNILHKQLSSASNNVGRNHLSSTRNEGPAPTPRRTSVANGTPNTNNRDVENIDAAGNSDNHHNGNNSAHGEGESPAAIGENNRSFELLFADNPHAARRSIPTEVTISPTEVAIGDRTLARTRPSNTEGSTEKVDTRRYVFGTFNEGARIMCAVAVTHEMVSFIVTPCSCKTLGISYSVGVNTMRIISSPSFKRPEVLTSDDCEEGEILFACASQHNILICQQKLFRRIEEVEMLVIHPRRTDSSELEDGTDRDNRRHGTWYFLKGYSYHASMALLRPLLEVSSLMLQAVVAPRPIVPEYLELFKKLSKKEDNVGKSWCQQDHANEPHKTSWWYPQRDGHPYFQKPFVLFISKLVGYLLTSCRDNNTNIEGNSTDTPRHFQSFPFFDGIAAKRLNPSAIALSPTHAFFVLGMENGSILLVSPVCVENTNCQAEDISSPVGPETNEMRYMEQLVVDSIGEETVEIMGRGENPHVDGQGGRIDGGEDEDEGSTTSSETGFSRTRRPPINHIYRTTLLTARERGHTRRQRSLRSFTAQKLFGSAFMGDSYIKSLQQESVSVLQAMENLEEEEDNPHHCQPTPLHAVWIHAPRDCYRFSRKSGIWSMHLDDWKLTTLNKLYELVIYDMKLRPVSKQNHRRGFVFAPLLTLSPYLSHPFLGVPMKVEENWTCSWIRKRIQMETERSACGDEIRWHNGVLLVAAFRKGWRYSVFDFSVRFRDPSEGMRPYTARTAYSTSLSQYKCSQSNLQMMVPLDFKKRERKITLPRHYPVLRRVEISLLMRLVIRPITLMFLCVSIVIAMLHRDGYTFLPNWVATIVYSPFGLDVAICTILDYDRYYMLYSGVPYAVRLLSIMLMYIGCPILFTLRVEFYPSFNTPWVILCIPLCVSILLRSVPSAYVKAKRQNQCRCTWVTADLLQSILYQCLVVATILLVASFFDGPSADDAEEPKFHLAIAFAPTMFLILLINIRAATTFFKTGKWKSYFAHMIPLLLLGLQVMLFIGEFKEYYKSLTPSAVTRPSLLQSLFVIPLALVVVALYKGYVAAMVFDT